jgi:hypothetical protein
LFQSFPYGHTVYQHHLLKGFVFSNVCFWCWLKSRSLITGAVWIYSWSSILLIHLLFFVAVHCWFCDCLSSIIWNLILWYLQHCHIWSKLLCQLRVFCASKWILDFFPIFMKNAIGIWMEVALNP